MHTVSGINSKMYTSYNRETSEVSYFLNLDGEKSLCLNDYIGQEITLVHNGNKECLGCHQPIRGKAYSGGYCYPCFSSLPQTDMCILKPEQCHFHLGTCRDPKWGEEHCFKDHALYLARSSNIKVGITRKTQLPTRWIDQGATEAMVIGFFKDRKSVGDAEVIIAKEMSDKTSWQKMLKNDVTQDPFNIYLGTAKMLLQANGIEYTPAQNIVHAFKYPVLEYPTKVKSLKFDKSPLLSLKLVGIKGQYLIFEDGQVLNLRAHGSYHLDITFP